jgi:hypothetical protein
MSIETAICLFFCEGDEISIHVWLQRPKNGIFNQHKFDVPFDDFGAPSPVIRDHVSYFREGPRRGWVEQEQFADNYFGAMTRSIFFPCKIYDFSGQPSLSVGDEGQNDCEKRDYYGRNAVQFSELRSLIQPTKDIKEGLQFLKNVSGLLLIFGVLIGALWALLDALWTRD